MLLPVNQGTPVKAAREQKAVAKKCKLRSTLVARFCCLAPPGLLPSLRPGAGAFEDGGIASSLEVGISLSWRSRV
jgi:hypothetical protein